jgi:hypothetical protein
MAEIKFYANVKADDSVTEIAHTLGSGLGFYGSDFGISVPVGSQQTQTWTTDALGTSPGVRLHNTAMVSSGNITTSGEVSVDGGNPIYLDKLANYQCPLNIRFNHDTPVKVQNCKLRIFDRNNISRPASGVTTWVYEARHPAISNNITSLSFRADTTGVYRWTEFDPTVLGTTNFDMLLTNSPGVSGRNTNISDTNTDLGYISRSGNALESTRHDWYVALSSEPNQIGSKRDYGLYFTAEYL